MTLTIDDRLAERLRAVRGGAVDLDQVAAVVLAETAERWEREAAARTEAQAILSGPHRPFDPEATYQRYKEKYGWDDQGFSHLSGEELIEDTERLIAAMPPEKRATLEREGWL